MKDSIGPYCTQIRVRYAETDMMGIAYNSHFLTWFEVGRTELLRSLGLSYREIEEIGFRLPLIEAGIQYLKPAAYDDVLTIESNILKKPGARLRIDYEIKRNGEQLATGFTVHAFTDDKLRPIKPQKKIRDLLTKVQERSTQSHKKLML